MPGCSYATGPKEASEVEEGGWTHQDGSTLQDRSGELFIAGLIGELEHNG